MVPSAGFNFISIFSRTPVEYSSHDHQPMSQDSNSSLHYVFFFCYEDFIVFNYNYTPIPTLRFCFFHVLFFNYQRFVA
jgi:hypothetical protein